MDDQTSHEMTPEEARVRLRQAAGRLESLEPLRPYVWHLSAAALGTGLLLGYFPSLRRGAVRSLRALVGRRKDKRRP